jgi:hypothetical protein
MDATAFTLCEMNCLSYQSWTTRDGVPIDISGAISERDLEKVAASRAKWTRRLEFCRLYRLYRYFFEKNGTLEYHLLEFWTVSRMGRGQLMDVFSTPIFSTNRWRISEREKERDISLAMATGRYSWNPLHSDAYFQVTNCISWSSVLWNTCLQWSMALVVSSIF